MLIYRSVKLPMTLLTFQGHLSYWNPPEPISENYTTYEKLRS